MKKILIVDDEPDVRLLIRELLTGEGYEVAEAANGKEALKQAKVDPDLNLILLDVMMPEMDGLHTAHEIRKFSKIPIVFVSVKDDDVTMGMAKKLYGAKEYVKKPFDNAALLKTVKKYAK